MKKQAVVIHELDNVATCVDHFTAGTAISYFRGDREEQVLLCQDIPLGHKFAIRTIAKNEDVRKYAESIGVATIDIQPGQHVHVHNLESKRGRGDLEQCKGDY
ncbi:altronate dehydratase [Desulfitobacterium dichloroeliminans LMG P-21439]|uniref:Altronate dehydratase n=1 Tax=Desulfitobacterium dichloroeliminans (strain LMG P-21439 / DCA1) TaxID=871963 RepID=L0F789_DESDL|nr:UxaA family hydrolase [Desulfitobacterium dichloroeliminans]AGA69704.1 altronate dehydratase [Desulfitobacterium dichloroeliminans LMG P-21439]